MKLYAKNYLLAWRYQNNAMFVSSLGIGSFFRTDWHLTALAATVISRFVTSVVYSVGMGFTLLALLLSFYHSIRSILCSQQTGEIDNLIEVGSKVLGCVVCRFHVAAGEKLHADKQLSGALVRSVPKLASIIFWSLAFSYWFDSTLVSLLREICRCAQQNLPLGVPNWVP
jgi:hypothetical protein